MKTTLNFSIDNCCFPTTTMNYFYLLNPLLVLTEHKSNLHESSWNGFIAIISLEKVYSLAKDYILISHSSRDRISFDILLLCLLLDPSTKLFNEDSFNETLQQYSIKKPSFCINKFQKSYNTIVVAQCF